MAKSWPKPGEKNFRQVDGNPASKSAESRKLVLIPGGMTRKTPRDIPKFAFEDSLAKRNYASRLCVAVGSLLVGLSLQVHKSRYVTNTYHALVLSR